MLGAAVIRALADESVFIPRRPQGHYESHFLRANHPTQKQAFWIRYTVFQPAGAPQAAIGELWAIFFDGSRSHVVAKEEFPLQSCAFGRQQLSVRVGKALLSSGGASGKVKTGKNSIAWQLELSGGQSPLLLLPENRYSGSFPKAKSLVSVPFQIFSGTLTVNDKRVQIKNWVGSRNHNWGRQHTDDYAWGQVAGFDRAPDVFLEIATARIRVGPVWTPYITPIALRLGKREYALNAILSSMRRARFRYFHWDFRARTSSIALKGFIEGQAEDFVCLPYYNPPGGIKYCLNTKVASCRLNVTLPEGETTTYETDSRAAFEILTDDATGHGLPLAFPPNPKFLEKT